MRTDVGMDFATDGHYCSATTWCERCGHKLRIPEPVPRTLRCVYCRGIVWRPRSPRTRHWKVHLHATSSAHCVSGL